MDSLHPTCSVYAGASVASFVFSVLLTIGIFISYVPQYVRIYRLRTSEGLSTKFLLLGSTCSVFTITNIALVGADARACCHAGALSAFDCASSQLNTIQITVQCACAVLMLVAVLVWTRLSPLQDRKDYHELVIVGRVVTVHSLLAIVQVVAASMLSKHVRYWVATVNGLLSMALTVIKYVPQIATTYSLKHAGTLSIGMMCIQTPGGMLFTATLLAAKGSHWSSWIGYLAALLLQGVLLGLCLYYTYRSQNVELNEYSAISETERDECDHTVSES